MLSALEMGVEAVIRSAQAFVMSSVEFREAVDDAFDAVASNGGGGLLGGLLDLHNIVLILLEEGSGPEEGILEVFAVEGEDDLVRVQGGNHLVLLIHHVEFDIGRDWGGGGEEGLGSKVLRTIPLSAAFDSRPERPAARRGCRELEFFAVSCQIVR